MFLGISLGVPLILVITLQDRKTLFCVFYCFRDLYGLKLTGDFSSINILPNMMDLSFETTQTEPGGGIDHGWRAHSLGAPPGALAYSSLFSRPSKFPGGPHELKLPYIKVPEASRRGGGA